MADRNKKVQMGGQTREERAKQDSKALDIEYEVFLKSVNYGDAMYHMIMGYAHETDDMDIRGVSMILFRQTALHLLMSGMSVDSLKEIIHQAIVAVEDGYVDSDVEPTRTLH